MPNITLTRRAFLRQSAAFGAAFGLHGLMARGQLALPRSGYGVAQVGEGGYGPLAPAASQNTGETLLALPAGFKYTVFGRIGTPMSDGRATPGFHDGMAAFAHAGKVLLVRNHEVRNPSGSTGAVPLNPARSYDPLAGGGTTNLLVDPKTRLPIQQFVSLSGTLVNCAGGPTPWNTWISCEETTRGREEGFAQDHGYCFEVPATLDQAPTEAFTPSAFEPDPDGNYHWYLPMINHKYLAPGAPVPLKAMGRFVHEAVAVDPGTGIVYETEDRIGAGFYRFLPDVPGKLAVGGRLQMLAIQGKANFDTRKNQQVGVVMPVTWVDISDPDPADAEQNDRAVYQQGFALGGATFARLEGCWYGNGCIYLNATTGGNQGRGQVWQYRPDTAHLTLIFESPGSSVLDSPDNMCVSPRGGLAICEDNSAPFVRGLTVDGKIFDVMKNLSEDENGDLNEFAGATFSPDGQTLFVNTQRPGQTFAIWGPWELGAL